MEHLDEMGLFYRLLKGFNHFRNKIEITPDLWSVYHEINGQLRERMKQPLSFSQFMHCYTSTPLGELIPFDQSQIEDIQYNHCYTLITLDGEINSQIKHYLDNHASLEDLHQKAWVPLLKFLRVEDKRSMHERQKDYNQVRVEFIVHSPFLEETRFYKLLQDNLFHEPQLFRFIVDAYVDYEYDEAYICSHCNYPMMKRYDRYHCRGDYFCRHYSYTAKKKETRKTRYKILREGFYYFTTLPGLFELKVEERLLKSGFKVNRHPDLERLGDLEVLIGEGSPIYLDCKVHQSEKSLFDRLQNGSVSAIDYYVLPTFLYQHQYKHELDRLNRKNGNHYQFVSEKRLVTLLKKKLVRRKEMIYDQVELF